ncbi:hypothetical protein D9M72_363530 [compost metagenome]
MTAVSGLANSGVQRESQASTSSGAGAAAQSMRLRGWAWRMAWPSRVARPVPGSPTAATTRPAVSARVAWSSASVHRADMARIVPDPGSKRPRCTRKTPPFGAGFSVRPLDRASISVDVLLAADCAKASSSSGEDFDHVVMLTLPSRQPVTGSKTGTAAQV